MINIQTKYNIVKQAIKSKILDGTYQPNKKIHSEIELMKQFGVSRHTVRLAIGDLVNQGWLYREQGSGTFCAERSKNEGVAHVINQKNIAIITTYISDYIFPSIIRGAEACLSKNGYNVILYSTNNDHDCERRILETILTHHFDGVIIEPTKSSLSNPNLHYYLSLERQNIPYIMINAYYDELEPISMMMDDEKGGFIQTEHLIKLGHTNILGLFKNDDLQGNKRMKGYLKAHRKYGVLIDPNNIITYNTEEKINKPVEWLRKRLSLNDEIPTGIVCYNDELAIRLLDVIRGNNLQVPDDISILGFDDSFIASVSEVKLTTVKHPQSKMGEMAAGMILDIIQAAESPEKKSSSIVDSVIFEPELIIRNSTCTNKQR